MLNFHKDVKIGDKFKNPLNLTTNTVVLIEMNHWYSGDSVYGEFYTLRIEEKNKEIQLNPALLSRFKKL